MTKPLYTILFLAIFNCSTSHHSTKDIASLVGKWKVSEPNNEYIIHISKDSIWEMYSYDLPGGLTLKITKHTEGEIQLSPVEKLQAPDSQAETGFQTLKKIEAPIRTFTYTLEDNRLTLVDQKNQKTTQAISCKVGGCDAEKDFFRQSNVQVSLPITPDEALPIFETENNTDIKIFVGPPKNYLQSTYSDQVRIWAHNKLYKLYEISLLLAYENFDPKVQRLIVFMDQEMDMQTVEQLFTSLSKSKYTELYLALKDAHQQQEKLRIHLKKVDVQTVSIKDKEMKLAKWLHKK